MALEPRDFIPALFDPKNRAAGEALAARLSPGAPFPGRVLRVKFGHNPNSSGIGTVALVFLWSTLITGGMMTVVSSFVLSRFALLGGRFQGAEAAEKPAPAPRE
ncbi:MAG: hypothetical protein HY719_11020 [Planctomycetes bacterium]|nr:hypothetical protein [Planctomycetota bacterium]